jgi:cysteine desulfuration protein SufE
MSAMSINEIQDELIDEFSFFSDWMEKYEHIIQMGKELPLIDEKYKTDDNLIRGMPGKSVAACGLQRWKGFFYC